MNDKGLLNGNDCLPLGPAKKVEPAAAQAPRRAIPINQQKFLHDAQGRLRTNGYAPK